MEKIESLNHAEDSKSHRLFECYRIALDFGLDAGNTAAKHLVQDEQTHGGEQQSKISCL